MSRENNSIYTAAVEHFKCIRLEELARQQALAEQKRLEHEREERERKRALNEIQQIKDRHLKEKMQQISQTSHGQKVLKKLDEDVSFFPDIQKLFLSISILQTPVCNIGIEFFKTYLNNYILYYLMIERYIFLL